VAVDTNPAGRFSPLFSVDFPDPAAYSSLIDFSAATLADVRHSKWFFGEFMMDTDFLQSFRG